MFHNHVVINRYHGLQKQPIVRWKMFGAVIPGESMLNQGEGGMRMNIRPSDFMYRSGWYLS